MAEVRGREKIFYAKECPLGKECGKGESWKKNNWGYTEDEILNGVEKHLLNKHLVHTSNLDDLVRDVAIEFYHQYQEKTPKSAPMVPPMGLPAKAKTVLLKAQTIGKKMPAETELAEPRVEKEPSRVRAASVLRHVKDEPVAAPEDTGPDALGDDAGASVEEDVVSASMIVARDALQRGRDTMDKFSEVARSAADVFTTESNAIGVVLDILNASIDAMGVDSL